jgi:general secretion pathway protein K
MSASARNAGPQRGIALLAMMLVLALCAALVARAAFANQLWLRQVSNQAAATRVDAVLRGAEQWIGLLLEHDDRSFDGATDPWAGGLPPIPAGNVTLRGAIGDLQARFNINNLVSDEGLIDRRALAQFGRLLQLLRLDPGLAEAIADWLDNDDVAAGPGGAESAAYATATPPRQPANRRLTALVELRQVLGVDRAVYQTLEPYLAALPIRTAINVNTALPEVLAAMLVDWGPAESILIDVRYWVEDAQRNPAHRLDEFVRRTRPGTEAPAELTIASRHFVARLGASEGGVETWIETQYLRDDQGTTLARARRRVWP